MISKRIYFVYTISVRLVPIGKDTHWYTLVVNLKYYSITLSDTRTVDASGVSQPNNSVTFFI